MPPKRQRASDYFSPEPPSGGSETWPNPAVVVEKRPVRRSTRLTSSPVVEVVVSAKKRKLPLDSGESAKKGSPKVTNATPDSVRKRQRKVSGGTENTEDDFVDAREYNSPHVSNVYPNLSGSTGKSPPTEEPYVSATEDVKEPQQEEVGVSQTEESQSDPEDVISKKETPQPSTRGSDKIPSSQPRPRVARTPIPLQVRSESPLPSLPPSTTISEVNPTQNSISIAPPPQSSIPEPASEVESDEDSDDEAPQAISLSHSRSQALEAQSQFFQAQKAQSEKTREKRRKRDEFLAAQKDAKKQKSLAVEIPPSDQSGSAAEISTGNSATSLDVPAPNQDHQAAREARRAEALPTSILQAASETWFDEPSESKPSTKKSSKKRKERDDGIRILDQVKPHLPPKSSKIAIRKEKMMMRMGRGERKMFIGRFTKK